MATIEQVTARYIELRDAKAVLSKKHAEEMTPYNTAMEKLEAWFLAKFQQDGVESFKTAAGTPYKSTATSVVSEDPVAFKDFIFDPAVRAIEKYLIASGYPACARDREAIINIIKLQAAWGLADIRPGKKGIQEYIEENKIVPPGIKITTFATVNVRRS